MELEEMKSVWAEMSQEVEKQKQLNDELILKMAHKKSSSRLNKIIRLESLGVIISIIMLVYLIVNFDKFNNWLSLTGGIGLTVIMFLSIYFGVDIVLKARKVDVIKSTYAQALSDFNELRRTLRLYKKFSIAIYLVIPFLMYPVMATLFFDKNLLDEPEDLLENVIVCIIVLPIVWFLIYRFYKSNMSKVSKAIKDVEKVENN